MADQPRKKPREVQWFDDSKVHLFAEPLKEGARSPRLRIIVDENNNPVVDVDYGITTEPKYEGAKTYPIRCETPMSPRPLRELLEFIIKVSAYKGECAYEFTNWGRPWVWNKEAGKNMKADKDMVISRFEIAKTEAGLVTLSVAQPRGQTAVFEFREDKYHKITSKGQEVSISITSGNAAAAWAGFMRDGFNHHYINEYEEPEWRRAKRLERAQQFAGQQQGGGSKPQYQQRPAAAAAPAAPAFSPSTDFDDELPF